MAFVEILSEFREDPSTNSNISNEPLQNPHSLFYHHFFRWKGIDGNSSISKLGKTKRSPGDELQPRCDPFVCSSSMLHTQHQLHPGPQQFNSLKDVDKSGWMLGFSVELSKNILMENRFWYIQLCFSYPPMSLEAAWISGSTVTSPFTVVSPPASQHTGITLLDSIMRWFQYHFSFLELTSKIPVIIHVFLPAALNFHWSLLLSGGQNLAQSNYPTGNPEQR